MRLHKKIIIHWLWRAAIVATILTLTVSSLSFGKPPISRWAKARQLNFPPATVSDTQLCKTRTPLVAVLDTGADYTHPSLTPFLWLNYGEIGSWNVPKNWTPHIGGNAACNLKSCNDRDDDGSGLPDDLFGWDFVHNVPLPWDIHGHGTHIAGLIAQESTDACKSVRIMPLKYYDNSVLGHSNLTNTVRAIRYATFMRVNIINYSGGGSDPAPDEMQAVEAASKAGILIVAAAGNNGQDNDWVPYYPASYTSSNIIAVANVGPNGKIQSASNWGKKSVDVATPGTDILSLLPEGRKGLMSGTSQSTAIVSGILARLWYEHPNFSAAQIKQCLFQSTTPHPQLRYGILKNTKQILEACY